MKSIGSTGSLVALAVATLLAACGSSSSSGVNGGTTAGTTGFTRGVITAFGSVHLGDKVFTTSATTIRKRLDDGPDNIPGSDDATTFRKGMVVEVCHKSGDLNAVEIQFKDDLEGPVTDVTDATHFDVLASTSSS